MKNKIMSALILCALAMALLTGCAGSGGGSDPLSDAKAITAFALYTSPTASSPIGIGTIDESARAIAVTVPYGTNVTALVAGFITTGSSVSVDNVNQASGTTPNDFTNPVAYVVTAGNGSTATYTVTVTKATGSAKAITAFALATGASGTIPDAIGTINEPAKTIAVTVPYGTNVTALVATFITTGASVKIGSTVQVSGTTPNNFSSPVDYFVTAADTTTATYRVTVTVAPSSAKSITAFSLLGILGTINESAKTIAVTVPYGTNVTALVATFSTTGAVVSIGTTTQESGHTSYDFTNAVVYTVTAADGSKATYTVTVTVQSSTLLKVVSTSPAADAIDVSTSATVTVIFSEDLNPETITGSSFYLFAGSGEGGNVSGTVASAGATVTFTPSSNLFNSVTYHAVITTNVKSVSGNALAGNYLVSFTTQQVITPTPRHLTVYNSPNTAAYNRYGRVQDNAGKINCGVVYTDCEADYDDGASVQLTAIPLDGFDFLGWTGDSCYGFGTTNPIILDMNGPTYCTPNWEVPIGATFTMTVSYGAWVARIIDDTGYMFWTDPRAIDCGPAPQTVEKCEASFPAGYSIAFRAYPNPLAPAGNFRWECTSENPFDTNLEYYTGDFVSISFLRDMSCNVLWIPN